MADHPDKRYKIGEVSKKLEVSIPQIREWEKQFRMLRPHRDNAGRRYFLRKDIDLIRRINYLLRHEKLTIEGARQRLTREAHGQVKPESRQDMIDLADAIKLEARGILDLLDKAQGKE